MRIGTFLRANTIAGPGQPFRDRRFWRRSSRKLSSLRFASTSCCRWHDLRHTFCSRPAQAGVGLKVIQEQLKTRRLGCRPATLAWTTRCSITRYRS
jgi:integrase